MSNMSSSADTESIQLSEHNLCFYYDLPVPLWLDVWEYLPLDDLLAASHVCRTWNTLIASYPRLWSEFRITSPHDYFQGFLSLDAPDGGYVIPASASRSLALDVPGMPSASVFSITRLAALLHRSTSVTLSICVVLHSDVSVHFVQGLSQILHPHKDRVHELRIFHTTPSPALRLLDALVPLASLRGLWLYTPAEVGAELTSGWHGLAHGTFKMHHLVYGHPSCFPRLTDLKTSFSVAWPEKISPLHSLRSLDIVIHDFWSLLNALMSCPSLDTLTVDIRFTWTVKLSNFQFDKTFFERVSRISTVRLDDADVSHHLSLLKLFDNPQRPVYEVEIGWRADYVSGTNIAYLPEVLSDIAFPTVVRCTLSDDEYTFTCSDDFGRRRLFIFPDYRDSYAYARHLLLSIETDDLREASLPLMLWLDLADEFFLPGSLEVLELTSVQNGPDTPLDLFGGIDSELERWCDESARLWQHAFEHDSDSESGSDDPEIDRPDECTIRIRFSNPHGVESETGISAPVTQVLQYLNIIALSPNADVLHGREVLDNEIGAGN